MVVFFCNAEKLPIQLKQIKQSCRHTFSCNYKGIGRQLDNEMPTEIFMIDTMFHAVFTGEIQTIMP
jgi:hypothetical protein